MTTDVLDSVLLTAAPAAYGTTVGASTKRKYTFMKVSNETGGTVTLRIWLVPSGSTAINLNSYIDYDIIDKETYLCPEVIGACLQAGGQLWASGLNLSLSAVASDGVNT